MKLVCGLFDLTIKFRKNVLVVEYTATVFSPLGSVVYSKVTATVQSGSSDWQFFTYEAYFTLTAYGETQK